MDDTSQQLPDAQKLAELDKQLKTLESQVEPPKPTVAAPDISQASQGQVNVYDMSAPPPPDTSNVPSVSSTPGQVADAPTSTPNEASLPKTTVTGSPSSKLLIPLGILFFVIVAGIAAFLGTRPISAPTPSPTPQLETPAPTPQPELVKQGELYVSEKYGFSFKHMELSEGGTISGPAGNTAVELITLADLATVIPDTDAPFDGFSIHVQTSNGQTLDEYIESQKVLLLENYKLFGDPTEVEQFETQAEIGDKEATLLTGYTWWGADLYFVELPGGDFLVLAKGEQSPGSFDETFDEVLASFVFTEQPVLGKEVNCSEPRPEFCTQECIVNPPFICGSDDKSYCSICSACSNLEVESYTFQDGECTAPASDSE